MSKDLFGAELDGNVFIGFLEKAGALLFGSALPLLAVARSKLPTEIDCGESASSSQEDAIDPLLWELNWSRS